MFLKLFHNINRNSTKSVGCKKEAEMTSTSSVRQNQIQYYLQGSSPSANKDALLHRLRGLCDNAAEADNLFEDHEMVYIISKYIYISPNGRQSPNRETRTSLPRSNLSHKFSTLLLKWQRFRPIFGPKKFREGYIFNMKHQ